MSDQFTPLLPARSYLYVPGDQPERMAGAEARGADAVILDLEDAVPPGRKDEAVGHVAEALGRRARGVQRWVRVEPARAREDLLLLATPPLDGVVLPKADAAGLATLDDVLAECEARLGLPRGRTRVIPLIETAAALSRLDALARAPRVLRLGMGEADLVAELGLEPGDDETELLPARAAVVTASAAAGLLAPTASTTREFRDLQAVRTSTQRLRRLGFRARTAIHPAQVAVVNDVFTPTAEQVAVAEAVVKTFEQADTAGQGVTIGPDGRMVDVAVVRSARELLARAELAGLSAPA
jgi:citrate lyase subunit beta/citryl-CoA lyase